MTPDDEMLIAYADGELDPLNAKRVERAMAADPAFAAIVEEHRALRNRLGNAFAPVLDQPIPDHLVAMLQSNVVPFSPIVAPAPPQRRWLSGLAVAASLVAGVALGTQWQGAPGPVAVASNGLVASGDLAHKLDTQLASVSGDTRMLASFRESSGGYCRVFAAPSLDGIACKDAQGWQLRQTRPSGVKQDAAYRQAASGSAAIMAAAQDMMTGDPLDEAAEKRALKAGWR
ncbi:MAG: anti-sigma factor [Sphingomonadales bacterium]